MSSIFAFTRDLRIGDQLGLRAASRVGPIVPVVVIDRQSAARLAASPRRAVWYCSAVASLARDLAERGVELVVRRGEFGPSLKRLAREAAADAVGWSHGYDFATLRAQTDAQSVLEEAGRRVLAIHDAPVLAPEDAAADHRRGDGYRAFVPYEARWREHEIEAPPPQPIFARGHGVAGEPLPSPDEFRAPDGVVSEASEASALRRCMAYVDAGVVSYAAARNAPAVGGTARLSADLSFGTLAARTVVRAVRERARDPFLLVEERASLRVFLRSFAMRDFFLQLAWFTQALDDTVLQPKMRGFAFARTHPQLAAWSEGRTGFPLVDAGIRELHATGWMHPRVREVAASFLCFDLGVDWRIGRDAWDGALTEDAPALATGNWQWIAGVGADLAAYPRIYNPFRAARRFDPGAVYIRRWVPELTTVPDDEIFAPDERHRARQLALDLHGPQKYPAPIVDHERAARAFLVRYRENRAT